MVDAPGKITLWGIEVFVATAQERSISTAARRLEVSPSSVSQQLSNLETALGTTLIDRSARPLSLTPAGRLFLPRADTILNQAAEARAELAMRDLARLSRFNLGVIEDFDADVTPALLTKLSDGLRDTRFLLETGASHRLHELLEEGALDVIVAADTGPAPPWMELYPLLEEPFVAAVPCGCLKPGEETLEALGDLPLIQYTDRHMMGRQIADHLSRQNLTLNHRFELDSYHAIMAMVAAGAGWTILTPLGFLRAERFRNQADLIPLPAPLPPFGRTISLMARRDILQDLPSQVAAQIRPLLQNLIVEPAQRQVPFLRDSLRIL